MVIMPWDFATVVDQLCEAAVDPERWPAALDVLSEQTGAFGTVFLPIDPDKRRPPTVGSRSLAATMEEYVRGDWTHRDERDALRHLVRRNGAATDLDLHAVDHISKSAYYQEFLAPFGLRWSVILRVKVGDDDWYLSIQRSIAQGPFQPAETNMLATFAPRMSSVSALIQGVGLAEAKTAAEALEANGMAAVMLDDSGRVRALNAGAEALEGNGFRIVRSRLVPDHPGAADAFDRVLHDLLRRLGSIPASEPIALPRRGKRPLLAHATRMPRRTYDILGACAVVVTLIDMDRAKITREGTLRTAFGLTNAEARVAARLADGAALEAIAGELDISYNTVRNHLRVVFEKTRVDRQSQLVALLARLSR